MAKASIAINRQSSSLDIATSGDVVSLVFEALAACVISDKEAAYLMALDPATLSRVKTGQARLQLECVWRLPDRFWFEFRRLVDERRGLSGTNEKRVRIARIKELTALLVEEAAS
ncbi:MAG: hypothetical protein ABI652_04070 [Acidobacteriota bacterium]